MLIKSVLSAIPTHIAMVVDISPWAIKCIDNKRRAFLWKGAEDVKGGTACLLGPRSAGHLSWAALVFLISNCLDMRCVCVGFG